MKIIIKPKKSDISRMLLTALRCNQELDFRDGSIILLSNQVLYPFLDAILEGFDEFDLKIRKLNSSPQEEVAQEEVVQEEVVQEEVVQEEVAQEEVVQEEVAQEEVVQDEVAQDEVAQDEVVQDEVAQDEVAQEEVPQEEVPQVYNVKGQSKRNEKNLPELQSLVQIAEFFAVIEKPELIARLMKIPENHQENFIALIKTISDPNLKVAMKAIESELHRKGIKFNTTDRIIFSNRCREYFNQKGYYVTFLNFLKLYQTEVSGSKPKVETKPELKPEPKVESKPELKSEPKVDEKKKSFVNYFENKSSKLKVEQIKKVFKLSDIPELKEAFDALDFTKSKEEAVNSILLAMNYQSLDKLFQVNLFETSCIAVSIKVVEWAHIDYNYKLLMSCDENYNVAKTKVGIFICNYFRSKGCECNYIKFLQLLKEEFGDHYLGQNKSINFIQPIEGKKETDDMDASKDDSTVEDSKTVSKVKLPCMPNAPDFEKFLGTLSQEESMKANLKKVLEYMGISKFSPKEQNMISEIANIAISMQEPSYKLVFEEIEVESDITAKAICSDFVNKFARKYDPETKIKFMDEFITELKDRI